MDLNRIKELLALMEEHDLAELEIEEDDFSVRLTKAGKAQSQSAMPVQIFSGQGGAPAAPVAGVPADAGAAPVDDGLESIEAPLVGTFYKASKPGADAFVKEGDTVTADSTICIIEAMKVMNEIKAEREGVIKEVLVEDGQSVEFGQPLFKIEPR